MTDLIHHDPLCFRELDAAGLPDAFIDAIKVLRQSWVIKMWNALSVSVVLACLVSIQLGGFTSFAPPSSDCPSQTCHSVHIGCNILHVGMEHETI